MDIQLINIEKVIPYARNPRKLGMAVAKVASSLKEFNWQQPIVVDTEMVVIAGHARLEAAYQLALKQVPVHIATNLTPEQVKAYRLADNRTNEESSWDNELLALELSGLSTKGFDLSFTGFELQEIENLLSGEPEEGLTDADNVPEEQAQLITQLGDVWLLGEHKLLCGDSTVKASYAALMENERADMVFTDPPYGMSYKSPCHDAIAGDNKRGDALVSLLVDSLNAAMPHIQKEAPYYICLTWRTYSEFAEAMQQCGLPITACIVWDKKSIGPGTLHYRPQHEFIFYSKKPSKTHWYGDKSQVDIWSMPRANGGHYEHPTQKPVELIGNALVNSSKQGDVVLDIFAGSGSTLIACERIARKARLIELEPKYCDVIIRRWQDFTGRQAIHATTNQPFNSKEHRST